MRTFLLAFVVLLLQACQSAEKTPATTSVPTAATSSTHSAAFNQAFNALLNQYYQLKDAFIAENDTSIQTQAAALLVVTDSLTFPDLAPTDTVLAQAKQFQAGLAADIKGLLGEKDREDKRQAFELVSAQLYALVGAVKYDQQTVYRQFCPMAFNDKGATWLSPASEIRNPYLPKTMLHCGEVKDSIDFRPLASSAQ